jgi:hypothetical protein
VVAGAAVLSTGLVGATARLGIRQLKEAHTGNRLVAFNRATDILIDPVVMEARQWVYANASTLEVASYSGLSPAEQHKVEAVWRAYDRIGVLMDHGLLIDDAPVLDMWAVAITRTYHTLEKMLRERRSNDNPAFAHNLDSLNRRAMEYLASTDRA